MMLDPFAIVLSFWASLCGAKPLDAARSWGVCYGGQASIAQLQAPDLLVLEPDRTWDPEAIRRPGQTILAYLSLGEINRNRSYYPELAAVPGLLRSANPDWPEAVAIDPRSGAWRDFLLTRLVPRILAAGYDGFFLDTVDVGAHLEVHDHLNGASAAMAQVITAIHQACPQALLISNGGVSLLPTTAGALSALAVESVLTDYRFAEGRYRWRAPDAARERIRWLAEQRSRWSLPIFVLEYVDPKDVAMRLEVARQAREVGFVPCVADIGLGELPPLP